MSIFNKLIQTFSGTNSGQAPSYDELREELLIEMQKRRWATKPSLIDRARDAGSRFVENVKEDIMDLVPEKKDTRPLAERELTLSQGPVTALSPQKDPEQKRTIQMLQNNPEEYAKENGLIYDRKTKTFKTKDMSTAKLSPLTYKPPNEMRRQDLNDIANVIPDSLLAYKHSAPTFVLNTAKETILGTALMAIDQVSGLQENLSKLFGTYDEEIASKSPVRDAVQDAIDSVSELENEILASGYEKARDKEVFATAVEMSMGANSILAMIGAARLGRIKEGIALMSMAEVNPGYREYIKAGESPEKALAFTFAKGGMIYWLEKAGLDEIMAKYGAKSMGDRAVRSFIAESGTETLQQFTSDVADKAGYGKAYSSLSEYWNTAWQAGVLGGGFGMAYDMVTDLFSESKQKAVQDLADAGVKDPGKVVDEFGIVAERETAKLVNETKAIFNPVQSIIAENRMVGYRGDKSPSERPGIERPAPPIVKAKVEDAGFAPLEFSKYEIQNPAAGLEKLEKWLIKDTYDLKNPEKTGTPLLTKATDKLYNTEVAGMSYRQFTETVGKERVRYMNQLMESGEWGSLIVRGLQLVFPRIAQDKQVQRTVGEIIGAKNFYAKEVPELVMKKVNEGLDSGDTQLIGQALLGKTNPSSLPENLKSRYDTVRGLFDFIHELNYQNGIITEKQYLANKGDYAPYMYRDIEMGEVLKGSVYQRLGKKGEKAKLELGGSKQRKIGKALSKANKAKLVALQKEARHGDLRVKAYTDLINEIEKINGEKRKSVADKILFANETMDALLAKDERQKAKSLMARDKKFIKAQIQELKKGERRLDTVINNLATEKERLVKRELRILNKYDVRVQQAYLEQQNREEYLGGLVTDPGYMVQVRLGQALFNNSVMQFYEEIKKLSVVSDVEKPGYEQLPDTATYKGLRGKYIRNDVVDTIKGIEPLLSTTRIRNVVLSYNKMLGALKASKLVISPSSIMANIAGNYLFAYLNDVPLRALEKNVSFAINDFKTKGTIYAELMKKGELKSDIISDDFIKYLKDNEKPISERGFLDTVREGAKKTAGFYGAVDDVYKIAAYKSLLEQGLSSVEALDRLGEASQNYRKVGRMFDWTSKAALPVAMGVSMLMPGIGPIIGKAGGSFIKFFPEMIRILTNGAVRNPIKTAFLLAALQMIAQVGSTLSGEDDETKKIREDSKYTRKLPFVNIPMEFRAGDNVIQYHKLMPLSEITDLIDSEPVASDYDFRKQMAQLMSGDVLLSPIVQLATNTDFTGNNIYTPGAGVMVETYQKGKFLFNAYLPQPLPELVKGARVVQGKPISRSGTEQKLWQWAVEFMTPLKIQTYGAKEEQKDKMYLMMGAKYEILDFDEQIRDTVQNEEMPEWEKEITIKSLRKEKAEFMDEFRDKYMRKFNESPEETEEKFRSGDLNEDTFESGTLNQGFEFQSGMLNQ